MNILLTSAGRRSYLVKYFKEAIGDDGIIFASNSTFSSALQVSDKQYITPGIFDCTYIQKLLTYCLDNNIDMIVPCFDIDLPVLAKNKHLFKSQGIEVIVSDYEVTQICNDKWKTFKLLQSSDLNTPNTCLSIDECRIKLKKGDLNYPLIIKPRWGMGSIGIYQADNVEELNVLYKKVKKDIFNSYLSFESTQDAENCVIIQQKLEGTEFGMDVFNDLNGNFLTCISKKKISIRAGETDIAETIINVKLYEIGKKLSESLHHFANLDVDCIKVGENYYILDLNCRFGGQYPFSHLAGANFPKAIINMVKGVTVEKNFLIAKPGITGFKELIPMIFNDI